MQNDIGNTTAAVEKYVALLAQLPKDAPADAVIHDLLSRAVSRLHKLCTTVLYRNYPRLVGAPLNLQAEELLSSVVGRLITAMQNARPSGVRQFFSLANQHMRWELNDLARRLDDGEAFVEFPEALIVAPESSGAELSDRARRMLEAIENLPEEELEVFSLVRIQGMSQVEAAQIVNVSTKTVQRRLNRSLLLLAQSLKDISLGAESNEKS
ncbi:sigma-70 family RNA polymerase sigma factor [Novipirellula sp.]|uniref:sigma-70 family RNA polymerase sigma factor n=1 Tax=Novipirellula sp. TaxID=2795430 RepID=UPI003566790A